MDVSVDIFQCLWELFIFLLTLFIVFITYKYTDGMYPLVYFRDYVNYSLLNALIINVLTAQFFSNDITDGMISW